jgi:transposase InsO family protein
VERRGQAIRVVINLVNWQQEEPNGYGGGRLSMDGTSRVTGDSHARICERLGVKPPGRLGGSGQPLSLPRPPHIHGELLKLSIDIGETSVGKYMVRRRRPRSQTWRTFLDNHLKTMVSVDFFAVPTIRFRILYVFLVLAHERRRIVHFAVTAHPTAEWTAQQIREAFPWDSAPRYLLRDRDRIFGQEFVKQVKAMGIKQVLSAPRSPWQRAYVERVIGTIRRECLDHLIVFNERKSAPAAPGIRGILSSKPRSLGIR